MAYYYRDTGNPANEDTIGSIILGTSLLTARGVPVAGEYEVKNAQAMKIMDTFGQAGLSRNIMRSISMMMSF
jgi:L-arabinose isomerase